MVRVFQMTVMHIIAVNNFQRYIHCFIYFLLIVYIFLLRKVIVTLQSLRICIEHLQLFLIITVNSKLADMFLRRVQEIVFFALQASLPSQ